MTDDRLFIVEFPEEAGASLYWWVVEDASVIQHGHGPDPLSEAGFSIDPSLPEPTTIIALAASTVTHVRWHALEQKLTDKQRTAAAIAEAQQASLDQDQLHICALPLEGDQVATVAIDPAKLSQGLVHLQSLGIDPDIVTPAGWLIPAGEDQAVVADFGFDILVRGERWISPDEPALRAHIPGADQAVRLSNPDLENTLGLLNPDQVLNLRAGHFVKKTKRDALPPIQKKMVTAMIAALLVISLLIPIIPLSKYHFAASDADAAALSAARSVLGPEAQLRTAATQLDQRLIAESRGNAIFTVPASAIFAVLQKHPNVSLGSIEYQSNGVILASLSAVRNEDIDPVLTGLQELGFLITAKARQDATGTSLADVTVRAP